jgi:hypothetical protein
MTARTALMQDESASYLGWGSSQGKSPSHQFMGGEAISAPTGLHCKDEASLSRGRQRSNFTVQAQRCERVREALRERHPTAKTPLTTSTLSESLSHSLRPSSTQNIVSRSTFTETEYGHAA